jgi:hypothetical protein
MLFIVGIAVARIRRNLTTFAFQRAAEDAAMQAEIVRQSLRWA